MKRPRARTRPSNPWSHSWRAQDVSCTMMAGLAARACGVSGAVLLLNQATRGGSARCETLDEKPEVLPSSVDSRRVPVGPCQPLPALSHSPRAPPVALCFTSPMGTRRARSLAGQARAFARPHGEGREIVFTHPPVRARLPKLQDPAARTRGEGVDQVVQRPGASRISDARARPSEATHPRELTVSPSRARRARAPPPPPPPLGSRFTPSSSRSTTACSSTSCARAAPRQGEAVVGAKNSGNRGGMERRRGCFCRVVDTRS